MKPIELRGHTRPVNTIKYNFDGDLFISGGSDKVLNLWSSYTLERLGSMEMSSAIKALDITNDSQFIVGGSLNGIVEIFETKTGKQLGKLQTDYAPLTYVELSYGDKNFLIQGQKKGKSETLIYNLKNLIKLFKNEPSQTVNTAKPDYSFFLGVQEHTVTKCGWGLCNQYFIMTTRYNPADISEGHREKYGNLIKCDDQGKVIKDINKAHAGDGGVRSFNFSKDYAMLATAASDGARIWNPTDLTCLRFFKQEFPMNSISISPLCGSKVPESERKYHVIMGGGIPAREVALSKKGGFEVHLCNITYGEEIGTISGTFGPINMLSFSPDGRAFLAAGEEGVIRLFKFDSNYKDIDYKTFETFDN